MDHRGLVVADDLTGATGTGDRFASRGYGTVVTTADGTSTDGDALDSDALDADAPDADAPDADVLVRDTDSRYCEPGVAAERVRAAIEATPAEVVYKKVDSTLRGNLAAEIGAAVEAAGAALAVVAPAYPTRGRTTVGGYHLLDGTPVAETEPGNDPNAPVRTSHLPTLLGGDPPTVSERDLPTLPEGSLPVAHLPIDAVGEGPETVAAELAERNEGHDRPLVVACDAARGEHLGAIAEGAARLDARVVYAGSGGLAGHVRLGDPAPVLGIAGSTAAETFAGLDALPDAQVVSLDGPGLFEDPETVIDEAAAAARRTLDGEGRVVVTAARDDDDVGATVSAAEAAGVDEATAREEVAAALGRVARAVQETGPVSGLFLTGGAVAAAAVDALSASGVRLTGRSIDAGIPIGRVEGGIADGTPVVTRPGAFGGQETILTCLDALGSHDG
ncbi:MAG: four-carbon acid sugar kinase family protein [Halobacteriales archaeon]